jgi:hypothetical protein
MAGCSDMWTRLCSTGGLDHLDKGWWGPQPGRAALCSFPPRGRFCKDKPFVSRTCKTDLHSGIPGQHSRGQSLLLLPLRCIWRGVRGVQRSKLHRKTCSTPCLVRRRGAHKPGPRPRCCLPPLRLHAVPGLNTTANDPADPLNCHCTRTPASRPGSAAVFWSLRSPVGPGHGGMLGTYRKLLDGRFVVLSLLLSALWQSGQNGVSMHVNKQPTVLGSPQIRQQHACKAITHT